MTDPTPNTPPATRRLLKTAAPVLGLAALAGLCYWLYTVFSQPADTPKKRAVQEIALLKPPPPPPPPKTPPPPPPPKQEQQKVEVPKPDAAPDKPSQAPPPGPDLAVDAAGSGSGDGFGLVGKPGGAPLVGGTIGGGGGNRFAWYGALLKDRIQDAIRNDRKLKAAADYQRVLHVWVSASGTVTRVELLGAGSSADLDEALKTAVRALPPLNDGAPNDMPQPIRLRVSTRS